MKMQILRGATGALFLMLAAPSWSINIVNGQNLYNLHCASCHGITGIPVMPAMPNMPPTPNLQMREGMNQPDIVLIQTLKAGKTTMPPFLGRLNDQQLLDIIHYIRNMR